jgi:hypothetical protein
MKLTWFGGTTLRVHIGGRILVADPAPQPGLDLEELTSGADATFSFDGGLPEVDPVLWKPERPGSMLNEGDLPEVLIHGIKGGALIAALGEPPVLLLTAGVPDAGRWSRDAVVVVFGQTLFPEAKAVLKGLEPRLLALAGPESAAEAAAVDLIDELGDTALIILESGLPLEV